MQSSYSVNIVMKGWYIRIVTEVVPRIHFGKAEVAYRHCGLASYISTWCSCILQSYILLNISLCYYLHIQLAYLNGLYVELLAHA